MTAARAVERTRTLALLLVLSAVVGAVYGRALDAPFVHADRDAIVENPSIRRLWPPIGTRDEPGPLRPSVLARPLVSLSFALDYRLHGLGPVGWRVTHLALHALAALLLAALVRRTLRLPYFTGAWTSAAWPLSVAAALVWAVHPLATQALVSMSERPVLLGAVCWLAALWAALRHWTAATPEAARAWAGVATVASLTGMASTATVVALPLAVLLFERTFFAPPAAGPLEDPHPRPLAAAWRQVRRSWRLYAGIAAGWVVLVASHVAGASGVGGTRQAVPLLVWWVTQVKVHLLYLKLAAWPWPLTAHYAPSYLRTPAAASLWVAVGALTVATAARLVRGRPAARFVVVAIGLVLAPPFLVPRPEAMAAEPRTYLALAGLVTLAVVGGARALGTPRLVRTAGLAAALLAALSVHRLGAYGSAVALWRDAVARQPADPVAQYQLGVALVEAGHPPAETMPAFETALRLDPAHPGAHARLGLELQRLGRRDEARRRLEQALALDPRDGAAHAQLGAVLLDADRPAEALPHLERALAAEGGLPRTAVLLNLGKALIETGRPDVALAHLERAARLEPENADAHYNRGVALLALGRPADAAPALERALALAPGDPQSENNLASALLQTGRFDEAIVRLERVLAQQPDDVAARNNLGTAFRTLGRTAEAIEQFTVVLARDPAHAAAHYNLGSALLDGGRPDEALPHFEAVLRADPTDAAARFKTAIALTHAGRRAEGIAAAEAALVDARAHAQPVLVGDIEDWLAAYRTR